MCESMCEGVYSFVELMGTGELPLMEQFGGVYMYSVCAGLQQEILVPNQTSTTSLRPDKSPSAVAASRPTLGVLLVDLR